MPDDTDKQLRIAPSPPVPQSPLSGLSDTEPKEETTKRETKMISNGCSRCAESEMRQMLLTQQQQIAHLESQVSREQAANHELLNQLRHLRTSTTDLLDCCEQAQEGICNRLLREIARLKQQQLNICEEVEAQDSRLLALLMEKIHSLRLESSSRAQGDADKKVESLPKKIDQLGDAFASSCSSSSISASAALSAGRSESLFEEHHGTPNWRQLRKLQEENQELLIENTQLKNRLRRMSVEADTSCHLSMFTRSSTEGTFPSSIPPISGNRRARSISMSSISPLLSHIKIRESLRDL